MFKMCYGAKVSWKGKNPEIAREGWGGKDKIANTELEILAFRFRKSVINVFLFSSEI